MITLTLPVPPPSLNNIYINVRGRGRVKSSAYRRWRDSTVFVLRAQHLPIFDARVAVEIVLPRAIRGDADNRAKACLDVLQAAGIVTNDRLCDPVHIGRGDVRETTITIRSMSNDR